jgi:hypothetical protein
MSWTAGIGAVGLLLKQVSDVVKDQTEVWGNVGWAAEEITVLKDRLEKLEKKVVG